MFVSMVWAPLEALATEDATPYERAQLVGESFINLLIAKFENFDDIITSFSNTSASLSSA